MAWNTAVKTARSPLVVFIAISTLCLGQALASEIAENVVQKISETPSPANKIARGPKYENVPDNNMSLIKAVAPFEVREPSTKFVTNNIGFDHYRKNDLKSVTAVSHETAKNVKETFVAKGEKRLVNNPVKKVESIHFEEGCETTTDLNEEKTNDGPLKNELNSVNKIPNADKARPSLDISKIVKNPSLRKTYENQNKPEYQAAEKYEEDEDFSGEDDLDFYGADYPIIHDGIHVPQTKIALKNKLSRPKPKDSNEESEEEEVVHQEKPRSEHHHERVEDVKELIRKLRRAGVSWKVIRRELYGIRDDYLEDYAAYRPEIPRGLHYLHHRRRRPYYGRYPYFSPYAEEDYLAELMTARRQAEKLIRPIVYYDDEYKKKK